MKVSRIMIIIMLMCTILGICGCKKEDEAEELDVKWRFDCESEDERLYETIVGLHSTSTHMGFGLDRDKEGMEKYNGVRECLTRVMLNNIDDEDKEYHVLMMDWNNVFNGKSGLMTQENVDEINEKYNRDFQLDEWVHIYEDLTYYYYYVFTADEILDLADYGIECMYVGSGEGNIEDVNSKTPEGLATYCELCGDGVIQYKKGQKIYY